MLSYAITLLLSFLFAALGITFFTLLEQNTLGYMQIRNGPNKVGLIGLPQPIADAVNLFTNENASPAQAISLPFLIAPAIGLVLSLILWALYPHSAPSMFFTWGALFFLCISSLNVYTTLIAGWTSNSNYALLGALRAVAQTISYEVTMSIILLGALILLHSMEISNISSMPFWTSVAISPLAITWFIVTLAETNRAPFDLAEGESEIVSGFNIEYSGAPFAIIFMAEYLSILVMSLFSAVFFTGASSDFILAIKTALIAWAFIWVRASYPRIRYDQLMSLTWNVFLPLSLAGLALVLCLVA